jgi:hypothetical protein
LNHSHLGLFQSDRSKTDLANHIGSWNSWQIQHSSPS